MAIRGTAVAVITATIAASKKYGPVDLPNQGPREPISLPVLRIGSLLFASTHQCGRDAEELSKLCLRKVGEKSTAWISEEQSPSVGFWHIVL
jgi:hypothetical protein